MLYLIYLETVQWLMQTFILTESPRGLGSAHVCKGLSRWTWLGWEDPPKLWVTLHRLGSWQNRQRTVSWMHHSFSASCRGHNVSARLVSTVLGIKPKILCMPSNHSSNLSTPQPTHDYFWFRLLTNLMFIYSFIHSFCQHGQYTDK